MSLGPEAKLPPSLDGSVVLDIGGDVGALVLVTGPELLGEELELTPCDERRKRVHTEVRERIVAGGRRFAAVYPQLAAGDYVLDCNRQLVEIRGGEITEIARLRSDPCHGLESEMVANIVGPDGLVIAVVLVLVLLFGGSKLPQLARGLGSASHEFKKGIAEGDAAEAESSDRESSRPTAQTVIEQPDGSHSTT